MSDERFEGELGRRVELALLLDFYGALLTDKQREVLSLFCEEDLSLSEIARESGITRQGAHETLTRGAARLTELEALLHLAERARRTEDALTACLTALKAGQTAAAQAQLEALLQSLSDSERA